MNHLHMKKLMIETTLLAANAIRSNRQKTFENCDYWFPSSFDRNRNVKCYQIKKKFG
jgi:hypothetical protein